MNKTIRKQIQDEIRIRKWSILDLAHEIRMDRSLLWRKVAPKARSYVPLSDDDIERIVTGLRTRNARFSIVYPRNVRRAA